MSTENTYKLMGGLYGGFNTRCYTSVHGFCFFKLIIHVYYTGVGSGGARGAAAPVKYGSRGLRPPKMSVNGACEQGVKKPFASLSDSRSSSVLWR